MVLFQNISDIISANINELIVSSEYPEKVLEQAICEIEDSISATTTQTAKAMAGEKRLSRELQLNQEQAERWRHRAALAVEAGDDDLAQKAIVRKNEHEKLSLALEDQLETTCESSAVLTRRLDGMRAKLSEAKRSLESLAVRQRAAEFRNQEDGSCHDLID